VLWNRVAKLQRPQGEVPVEALWMRAEVYHLHGFRVEAADMLKKLGAEAAAAGRYEESARAYLEVAILYNNVDRPEQARSCTARLDELLKLHVADAELHASRELRITSR
jgi:hypothetical protein